MGPLRLPPRPVSSRRGKRALGLGVEPVQLRRGHAKGGVVAGADAMVDVELRQHRLVPEAQVDELLVAEVLDHLDHRLEARAVAPEPRRELDVLGPEADKLPRRARATRRARRARGSSPASR